MENQSGFSFLMTTNEMSKLYRYLRNYTCWLCENKCYLGTNNPEKDGCLIHELQKRHLQIFNSEVLSNFEKRIFIKRMFKKLDRNNKNDELLSFLYIFRDIALESDSE